MKKNRHKYFRNKRYKQKLETDYNNNSQYIIFISDKNATNMPPHYWWRTGEEIEDYYWQKNLSQYRYWERPDVPYTILEEYWCHKGRNYKTRLKKYRNKQFRKNDKLANSSQKSYYKKRYEYWWDIY